ncbi:hypothetical protein FHS15_001542 [Paenibacillus castaneae]|uniref:hypothetical protein n=1 Tax=Paenibacillus castaneae TaxID=474957 RepID=UPI0011AF829F|nr:hypothetical protein [Paenibacillus castaneae]NIK76417.1 hypothetical protein [Paenibacillus castaneae]
MKPNFHELGLSISMGPKLRNEVERQLVRDLNHYHIFSGELRFDWSESCIEGKCLNYLDGSLDRYSGIMLYNAEDVLVADGWMDFLYEEDTDLLFVYWHYLDIVIDGVGVRARFGGRVPQHINKLLAKKTDM